MLHGQVVDTPTAQEFTRLALERVSEAELESVAELLALKSAWFRKLLAPDRLRDLSEEEWFSILRTVFSARRRSRLILDSMGFEGLADSVAALLTGSDPTADRLEVFHSTISDLGRGLPEGLGFDLGSELLHFTDPDRNWLWTLWIWNPSTGTGALPLVVMEEVDFDGPTVAETYRLMGVALAFVNDVGEAAGFRTAGHGMFGTDVFLASVYAVYMYTTLRMRMTQEFNRVVPELGDLVRRLLGVHRLTSSIDQGAVP